MLHEALDGAALAGCITAFKQQHHFLAGVLDPALGFQQFDLQQGLFVLIGGAAHLGLVGIDALLEQLRDRGFILADFGGVQPRFRFGGCVAVYGFRGDGLSGCRILDAAGGRTVGVCIKFVVDFVHCVPSLVKKALCTDRQLPP